MTAPGTPNDREVKEALQALGMERAAIRLGDHGPLRQRAVVDAAIRFMRASKRVPVPEEELSAEMEALRVADLPRGGTLPTLSDAELDRAADAVLRATFGDGDISSMPADEYARELARLRKRSEVTLAANLAGYLGDGLAYLLLVAQCEKPDPSVLAARTLLACAGILSPWKARILPPEPPQAEAPAA